MKTVLVILLCASLLLEGCYSYSALNEEERNQFGTLENDNILIVLNDGSNIESHKGLHVEITEPSEFVLGIGSRCKSNSRGGSLKATHFAGRLQKSLIDSSKLIRSSSYGIDMLFQCWLSDSSVMTFKSGDYVTITPDSGIGFWVIGITNHSTFRGKITPTSIHHIEVPKVSAVATTVSVIGVGLFVTMMVAVVRFGQSFGGR